jgi:hypothetical protein
MLPRKGSRQKPVWVPFARHWLGKVKLADQFRLTGGQQTPDGAADGRQYALGPIEERCVKNFLRKF